MPNPEFVCHHVSKTITGDDPDQGLVGEEEDVFDRDCKIVSPTFLGLLKEIGKKFNFDFTTVCLSTEFNEQNIEEVEYIRDEKRSGVVPTEEDMERWRDGKEEIYYAIYTFSIRQQIPITLAEIQAVISVDC